MRVLVLALGLAFTLNCFASLKLTSFNIRTYGQVGSLSDNRELLKVLSNANSDLFGFQEIIDTEQFSNLMSKNFTKYRTVFSKCGGRGKQKLALMYNKYKLKLIRYYEDGSLSSDLKADCDSLRPAFVALFKNLETQKTFFAVNVHLKCCSGGRDLQRRWEQYKRLAKIVNKLKRKYSKEVVLFGDFNTTGYYERSEDYFKFNQFLDDIHSRTASEDVKCTAYWSGENRDDGIEEPSILDHVIVSKSSFSRSSRTYSAAHCYKVRCRRSTIKELGSTYSTVSDHCPVSTTIR